MPDTHSLGLVMDSPVVATASERLVGPGAGWFLPTAAKRSPGLGFWWSARVVRHVRSCWLRRAVLSATTRV